MADCVSIPIRYVFCQESNEIGKRTLTDNSLPQSLVFHGEAHRRIRDLFKAVLSNRRPASIASRVSQEMLFGLEIIDMSTPPSVFPGQDCFEPAGMELGA